MKVRLAVLKKELLQKRIATLKKKGFMKSRGPQKVTYGFLYEEKNIPVGWL